MLALQPGESDHTFLEKTFGLKHSCCNFLLIFLFFPQSKWLILTGVVWPVVFMSEPQTEPPLCVTHLKGQKETQKYDTMRFCLLRDTL